MSGECARALMRDFLLVDGCVRLCVGEAEPTPRQGEEVLSMQGCEEAPSHHPWVSSPIIRGCSSPPPVTPSPLGDLSQPRPQEVLA